MLRAALDDVAGVLCCALCVRPFACPLLLSPQSFAASTRFLLIPVSALTLILGGGCSLSSYSSYSNDDTCVLCPLVLSLARPIVVQYFVPLVLNFSTSFCCRSVVVGITC